jgi:putative transposase
MSQRRSANVNPSGTSQTCPKCLVTVQKDLAIRVHSCPECKYETHRDHAAAEMALIRGLELVSTAGQGATTVGVDLPGTRG